MLTTAHVHGTRVLRVGTPMGQHELVGVGGDHQPGYCCSRYSIRCAILNMGRVLHTDSQYPTVLLVPLDGALLDHCRRVYSSFDQPPRGEFLGWYPDSCVKQRKGALWSFLVERLSCLPSRRDHTVDLRYTAV